MSEEKLLTPQEVAKQLNVSRDTVYSWIRRGQLPRKKIGGRNYIKQSDIDKYLIKE